MGGWGAPEAPCYAMRALRAYNIRRATPADTTDDTAPEAERLFARAPAPTPPMPDGLITIQLVTWRARLCMGILLAEACAEGIRWHRE